ncbi:hypothetical protein TIFTF001_031054 [Ficus carica]|uniref:S-locus receptor kinase C-terminal domain-containing protein n=1 Tax=Ficus carica TaxID=3494 RepID=A0AA88DU47_FICCA|nr:hypothetical protein TIFTF001_031054 [Ficus carica]
MAIELLDSCLRDLDHNLQEVLRCIHVGLICVQQRAVDRPSMSSVVLMLSSDGHVCLILIDLAISWRQNHRSNIPSHPLSSLIALSETETR